MLDPVVRAAAHPSRAILDAPARRYRLSETGNVTANGWSIWPGLKAAGRAARCRPPCPGPLPLGQSELCQGAKRGCCLLDVEFCLNCESWSGAFPMSQRDKARGLRLPQGETWGFARHADRPIDSVDRSMPSLPSAGITRNGVHPQIRLRVLVLSLNVGRCGQGRRRAVTSSLAPAHMGLLDCRPRGGEVSRIWAVGAFAAMYTITASLRCRRPESNAARPQKISCPRRRGRARAQPRGSQPGSPTADTPWRPPPGRAVPLVGRRVGEVAAVLGVSRRTVARVTEGHHSVGQLGSWRAPPAPPRFRAFPASAQSHRAPARGRRGLRWGGRPRRARYAGWSRSGRSHGRAH